MIQALIANQDPARLKIPKSTLFYTLEDLETQELIEREPWRLSKLAPEWTHWHGALEFLDSFLRGLPEKDWLHLGE